MRTKLTEEHKQKIREYYMYNNNPMLGKQYGDEVRKKISETQKKRLADPELRKRISKAVIRITENGAIEEYFGAREAERQTGINASAISACCKGKRKTAGDSQWLYKEEYEAILEKNKKIEVV